ncbi:hypothetical protein [Nocardia camponoti]|uniref:hypothetical protein n=1 Tax=Nocardia camponoti TaxID=1616106 RepID=UPI00166774EC|nr:hypothetical protein [Nocardia camponoti]
MTITDPPTMPLRILCLDPELGPIEIDPTRAARNTVTGVFGADETSPWRARRSAENSAVAP